MTFEKPFVAIRHESELMTPLIESPMMNFSLRELGYVGAFGLSAVFAVMGSIPSSVAMATFPLLILAFFRWHGEIPEMYVYFAVMSIFEPTQKAKRKKTKHAKSDIMGYGTMPEPVVDKKIVETIQRVKFIDDITPLDVILDVGNSHSHEKVTVLVDGVKVVHDRTNMVGQIVVSVMPENGIKKFSVRDSRDHVIIAKTVEFYDGR